jgi:hypothetical protein
MQVLLNVSGHNDLQVVGADKMLPAPPGRVTAYTIFMRIPGDKLHTERIPVTIRVEDVDNSEFFSEYESMFFGPKL